MTDGGFHILEQSGLPDVATVFVAAVGGAEDERLVEFVDGMEPPFPRTDKWIINVSTQFGCPIKCVFCDAGHRYLGNLTAGQMLRQVSAVLDLHPGLAARCRKLKVHFARMGEPALNDAVIEALKMLPEVINSDALIACIPTVAPVGRDIWFQQLLDVKNEFYRGRFQLQFSINTTDCAYRRRLMPANLHSLDWMSEYAGAFHSPGDRKVVLNFALAEHTPFDPDVIVARFNPEVTMVKITPLNPTCNGSENGLETVMRSSHEADLEYKASTLVSAGFDVILNAGDEREDAVGSNCGQSVRRRRMFSGMLTA
jgi:23S rRNA (adenine2503-C2)-methyltransferase